MDQLAGASTRSVVRHAAQTGRERERAQHLPTSAAIGTPTPPHPDADSAVRRARDKVGRLGDEPVADPLAVRPGDVVREISERHSCWVIVRPTRADGSAPRSPAQRVHLARSCRRTYLASHALCACFCAACFWFFAARFSFRLRPGFLPWPLGLDFCPTRPAYDCARWSSSIATSRLLGVLHAAAQIAAAPCAVRDPGATRPRRGATGRGCP
jgi:hypothetical protein